MNHRKQTTPGFLKPIFKADAFRRVLSSLAALYIRLVKATSRWTFVNEEAASRFWSEDKPFILAFWHGRLLMMPCCWRTKVPMNVLISQHRDGEIIANTLEALGLKTVRGSAGDPKKGGTKLAKGGAAALRAMARLMAAGEAVAISPDGPRGPRMRASEGIVGLARLTGLPVIPVAYAASRRRVLPSWDRFILPLPFSHGIFVWGDPITFEAKSDAAMIERVRVAIEDGLNRVTAEADRLAGVSPIEPDPIAAPLGALAGANAS